jgi:hypothetical protein
VCQDENGEDDFYVRAGSSETSGAKVCTRGHFQINDPVNIGSYSQIYKENDALYIYSSPTDTVKSNTFTNTSDDRLKIEEELITNATDSLLKLRPQKYKKCSFNNVEDDINNVDITKYAIESGLIAQEIYYEASELRHLVSVPVDATLLDDNITRDFTDIQNDPNYSNWGAKPASVNYIGLIPYLIKGFQEQQTTINTLQTTINTQQVEIDNLKAQMTLLINSASLDAFKQNVTQ